MELVTILTISQTIATWTNVFTVFCLAFPGVYLADRMRRLIYQAGLDSIALYVAWRQALSDDRHRQLDITRARLAIENQRRLLLDKYDEVAR